MVRIRFALCVILMFISFISSCKDSDSIIGNNTGYYNITGSVRDSSLNFTLHSTLVVCDTDTTFTDISGFFEFDHLKSGSHQLKAFKEDYLPQTLQIDLHSDIVLDIKLVNSYNITGNVKDSSLNFPIHSAIVICDTDTTITDLIGFFEFHRFRSGLHQLKVFKEDYLSQTLRIDLHSDLALNIKLASAVDYFPLLIGNSWKYHTLTGTTFFNEDGIDVWTVTDTSKFPDGSTKYSIHSVFNGKNYSIDTGDTTLIKDRIVDFIITDSSDHLLQVPAYISPYPYVITNFDPFMRYYSQADPDTIRMDYFHSGDREFKLYIKKDVGIVFSYYYFNAGNTHNYLIRTLIP